MSAPPPPAPTSGASGADAKWLLQRFKSGLCLNNTMVRNTTPSWNPATRSYEVDFGGRVTKATAKNIQLEDDHRRVLLTFGKVEEHRFILDFAYPISPIQAFALALCSFDSL
jgi:tubby-related protein 1